MFHKYIHHLILTTDMYVMLDFIKIFIVNTYISSRNRNNYFALIFDNSPISMQYKPHLSSDKMIYCIIERERIHFYFIFNFYTLLSQYI